MCRGGEHVDVIGRRHLLQDTVESRPLARTIASGPPATMTAGVIRSITHRMTIGSRPTPDRGGGAAGGGRQPPSRGDKESSPSRAGHRRS